MSIALILLTGFVVSTTVLIVGLVKKDKAWIIPGSVGVAIILVMIIGLILALTQMG